MTIPVPNEVAVMVSAIESTAMQFNWPRDRLWSDGFWPLGFGSLATTLDSGDEIVEVTPDYISIEHRGRIWNLYRVQA